MGRADDGGFVFIEDRLKDMIITGGENVYSPEIERILVEHPAIAEVAVIGVPDDPWGETIKAVVVLVPDAIVDESELITYTRGRLAKFKCPTSTTSSKSSPATPPERSSNATAANRTGRTETTSWSRHRGNCCGSVQSPFDGHRHADSLLPGFDGDR